MASSRITCPDCKSVLKPAQPVPDGKKIKCPKCGVIFTTPGLVARAAAPPRKAASAPKAKAAIKKALAPSPPPPPPPKPADDDDDDDGGIYGYVDDGSGNEEEDEKEKIDYAPDMSIKDLRGPAQAAVVKPSNYLLLIGGICCLLDILIICVSFWEMVFSDVLINHENFLADYYQQARPKKNNDDDIQSNPLTGGGGAAPKPDDPNKKKNIPPDRKDLDQEDLQRVLDAEEWGHSWPYFGRYPRFINIGVFIALFIYNAITIIGAVKMQNVESRRWGITSCIMTMLPFGSTSIAVAVAFLFYLLFAMLLDDANMGWMYAGFMSSLAWILAIAAGVYGLRALLSQEVIDGFEYVAD